MLRRDQPAMTVLLGALIAVAPLAMDIYLASMPSMTRALSATAEQIQLTLSLYMYGWGLSQIFVGPLTDRFGRRPMLIGGLALSTPITLFAVPTLLIAIRGRRYTLQETSGRIAGVEHQKN